MNTSLAKPAWLVLAALVVLAPATGTAAEPPARKADKPAPERPTATKGKPSPLEPLREAQRRFALGLSLYEEGDLRGALAEFQRANTVFPSYKVLYNLALVSRELYDWAGALRYYREYLDGGGLKIPAERRLQVEHHMIDLAERVGRLEIEIKGGPADVVLDELPVTLAIGEAIMVNPGRRRIRVTFPGKVVQSRLVEVASGDRVKVVFSPTPLPKGVTPPKPVAPPRERATTTSTNVDRAPVVRGPALEAKAPAPTEPRARGSRAGWAWAATGVLGAGALSCGLVARHSADALARERDRFPANPENLAKQQNRTRGFSIAADVALASTVVLAAISTYLSISNSSPSSDATASGYRWSF